MRYRKLRIAWSVVWGVVAVLLIALWVRSYWQPNTISFYETNADYFDLGLYRGIIAFSCTVDPSLPQRIRLIQIENTYHANPGGTLGFYLARDSFLHAQVPAAAVIIFFAGIAFVSWVVAWRFTVRTLLIATTLVALVLGAIVYAVR
jgi:hypothetical protein